MATFETLTKQRILAIEAGTVVGGAIVDDNLQLTRQDGSVINAGNVRGDTGPAGPGAVSVKVSEINYPLIIAHRGAASLFPEESMEGLEWASRSGFAIEVDVYLNASGSLVCCHDATVTRTMTGITGNVTAATDAQWLAARIKSPVKGGATAMPIFFEDVLDRFGGKAMLVPEVKQYDDNTVNAFMEAIISRGLDQSLIVQSFDYNTCVRMAANGLHVVYLVSGTAPTQTASDIFASHIEYVGGNVDNFSQTTVQNLKTAGLRVLGFNLSTPVVQEAALAKGMDGVFTDDPWFSSRRIQTTGNMPLDDPSKGATWPGARFYWYGGSGIAEPSPDPLYLGNGGIGLFSAPAATAKTRMLTCPWAEPLAGAFTVTIKGMFSTDYTDMTDSIGGVVWKNTSNADELWEDRAKTGQSGYTWLVRRNGQIAVWEYVNGAAAALVVATTAGDDIPTYLAPANNLGEFTLVLYHSGTVLRLSLTDSNRDIPSSVSAANTNTKTNLKLGFRFGAAGFITAASANDL